MSDTSQGPGWWQASDGRFYPPETHPNRTQPGAPPGPGWWLASDGRYYPPESRPVAAVPVVAAPTGGPMGTTPLPVFGSRPAPGAGNGGPVMPPGP